MPEILERLTTKIGPLPAWAWAAIPAGAYVAWSYYKSSQEPVVEPEIMPVGEGEIDSFLDQMQGGFGAAPTGSSNTTTPTVVIDTNLIWERQAVNWLIANGIDPSTAARGVGSYLYGNPQTVNSSELAALKMVLAKFGLPPEGGGSIPDITPAPVSAPAPAPTPVPVPAPAPVQAAPAASTPVQQPTGRPFVGFGSTGERVSQLQHWLITQAGASIGPEESGIYGQQTEKAVDNLLRFLDNGNRHPAAGSSGVNAHTWGLIDYISDLRGGIWRPN